MNSIDGFFRERAAEIDRELIRRLEIIYDRVPSNEEIARDIHLTFGPMDHRWYTLRDGTIILEVDPVVFTYNGKPI